MWVEDRDCFGEIVDRRNTSILEPRFILFYGEYGVHSTLSLTPFSWKVISLMAHNPNRSETCRYGFLRWGPGYNVRPHAPLWPSGSRWFPLWRLSRGSVNKSNGAGTNDDASGPTFKENMSSKLRVLCLASVLSDPRNVLVRRSRYTGKLQVLEIEGKRNE